jgi:protein phosphatase
MSPNRPQRVETASLSDVGRVRSANQDVCGQFENERGYRLLVVADGMGGHSGGETASRLALETIGQVFDRGFDDPDAMLDRAFQSANDKIHQIGSTDPALHNMGTTGVAVLLGPNDTGWVAHIGDSRAYRLRDGRFDRITEDHSWVSEEVRHGRISAEEAKTHSMKNVLLRSIGVTPEVEVTVSTIDVRSGDRYLLCSDGLWGEVEDQSIAEILLRENPAGAVRQLVDLANQNGGSDNVTVQIAALSGAEDGTPSKNAPGSSTALPSDSERLRSSTGNRSLVANSVESGWPRWARPAGVAIAVVLAAVPLWRACT